MQTGATSVDQVQLDVLDDLESAENYRDWLLELIGPHVRGAVLEVGAGVGSYSLHLRRRGESLTAIEPSSVSIDRLRERLCDEPSTTVVFGVDPPASALYDTVVMLNVLEHIEDDVSTLRRLRDVTVAGGRIVVWVPAFDLLMSDFDRRIGHHRRYRRARLAAALREAGYDVVECRYHNLVGFFGWLVAARVLRRTPTVRSVQWYDRVVVPIARRIDRMVRPPFGQSVLAVGVRPDSVVDAQGGPA